jgi:hypothetical protein
MLAHDESDGLLRLARHSAGEANPDLIAPQLCGQYRGQNGRQSAELSCFLSRPGLVFS